MIRSRSQELAKELSRTKGPAEALEVAARGLAEGMEMVAGQHPAVASTEGQISEARSLAMVDLTSEMASQEVPLMDTHG